MNWQNLDETIFRFIHLDLHAWWLDPVFWVISTSGLGYVQAIVVLLIPFKGWKQPSDNRGWAKYKAAWRNTSVPLGQLLLSIIVSGLVFSGVLKKLVERGRPSQLEYAVPQEGFYYSSFPSGHATTSFAIAFVLLLWAMRTGKWRIGVLAIFWACLVSFSRVYRGVHWPSDVIAGAAVGALGAIVSGIIIRKIALKRESKVLVINE